jgi:hypothetical protein
MWYRLGASDGNMSAQEHLDALGKKLSPAQREQAEQLAREHPRKQPSP